jgi:hypothetical protein
VGHSDRHCGIIIHMTRLLRLDASIRRDVMAWRAEQGTQGRAMMTLITINRVYYLIGFVVMLLVVMTLRDRANPKRFTTALFWFLFGGIFLFGDLMVQELGNRWRTGSSAAALSLSRCWRALVSSEKGTIKCPPKTNGLPRQTGLKTGYFCPR